MNISSADIARQCAKTGRRMPDQPCRDVAVRIPIRLVNELNEHKHFRVRQKRAALQHAMVCSAMEAAKMSHEPPKRVTITRFAPRLLDPFDNLPASMKHVVDALCDWWGIDDKPGCPVEFVSKQAKSKDYSVVVDIEAA